MFVTQRVRKTKKNKKPETHFFRTLLATLIRTIQASMAVELLRDRIFFI